VDALTDVLPEGLPTHLLEPGVDDDVFAPNLSDFDRQRLCEALDVPADAWITVYAGANNAATVDDIFSLYTAVHALNALGHKVHLIRTGTYRAPETDARFARFSRAHVTNLGFVQRNWLVEILKLADFFVQPGGPDAFNNYRLPSKIPEFLAMGRPVVLARANVGLRLQDGVNALLMKRGDAAEITECVKALLVDPALADRVGSEGRRFAIAHFDWQRSTKQLEGFYRELLASTRRA
jgi:glycosyltransferase involved in cell wall biosynthesis